MPINVNKNNTISPNTNIFCINGGFTIPDTRYNGRKHADGELNPGHTPLKGGVIVNCTTTAVVLKKSFKFIHCFVIYFTTTSIQFIIAISSLYLHDCGNKIRSHFICCIRNNLHLYALCVRRSCAGHIRRTLVEEEWSTISSRIILL